MSWSLQLVQSTIIDRSEEMQRALYWAWQRYKAETCSLIHWNGATPKYIKLIIPYDTGFNATSVMEVLQKLLQDGEWMVFSESADCDVAGSPITLYAITHQSMAVLTGRELSNIVLDQISTAEELMDG